jgi:hypothetical protein
MPQFLNRHSAERKAMRFAESPKALDCVRALLFDLGNLGPERAERLKDDIFGILKHARFETPFDERLYLGARDLDGHGFPPRFARLPWRGT